MRPIGAPEGFGFAREYGSVDFWVEVGGSGPFTFQWCKDALPIPGATSRLWTLQPVKAGDAGTYTCVVRNIAGEATTAVEIHEHRQLP